MYCIYSIYMFMCIILIKQGKITSNMAEKIQLKFNKHVAINPTAKCKGNKHLRATFA